MKNNTMSILFASDPDSHLNDLTIHRTTASLPFAGRYRLIDFTLSNLVHANITTIGIVTRSNYNSLMDHMRMGRDWDLNRKTAVLRFSRLSSSTTNTKCTRAKSRLSIICAVI